MEALQAVLPLIIVVLSLYYYFTRNFNYWKSRNVPGPKPVVFFGNLMDSTLRRRNIGEIFMDIYKKYPKEKYVGVYRMTSPALFLRDLDVIKHVMIKDFNKFEDRGFATTKKGLGENLFQTEGEQWRILRTKLTPIFTSGKLKNMMYLITEQGDKFLDYVEEVCQRSNIQEVHSVLQKYTVSTISACAFGLDINSLGDKIKILNMIDSQVFQTNYATELDMMYPGILQYFDRLLFSKQMSDFFENLVKTVVTQRNGVPSNAKDFMDNMLELRKEKVITGTKIHDDSKKLSVEITDSLMAAQAFVFYIAGFETSATTMTFLLYELAKNPDVQDKLIREVDEVLYNHKGEVTYEAIKDMKYMQKVFDETLRMYPIVEPLQRIAKEDYHVPGTDLVIEKGMVVLVSPKSIQRDPQYYPEPDKFDPERFAPDVASSRHTCAYMPFGVGPRNCIGMRFAKVQSQVCITKLLSRYTVTTCEKTPTNIQYSPTLAVLGPDGGITLKILPRKL